VHVAFEAAWLHNPITPAILRRPSADVL